MDEARKPKSSRVLLAVLLVILSLGVLSAAVVALGGVGYVMDLVSGPEQDVAEDPVPPRPSAETTTPATPSTPSADPVATSGLVSEMDWMYWEQVDSQKSIQELVDDEWESFEIESVDRTDSTATLRLSGEYREGGSLSGDMVFRANAGNWYFSSITADGNESLGPEGRKGADTEVVSTIVDEQSEAANQDLIAGLLDGDYQQIEIDSVNEGSGTATIDITLSGGTKGTRGGRIVCIEKTDGGRTYWFVTRCEEI